jgi:hypothetical protein
MYQKLVGSVESGGSFVQMRHQGQACQLQGGVLYQFEKYQFRLTAVTNVQGTF